MRDTTANSKRYYESLLSKNNQPRLTYEEMISICEYILSHKDKRIDNPDIYDIRLTMKRLGIDYERYCNSANVLQHFAQYEYDFGLGSCGAKSYFKFAFKRQ